MSQFPKGLLILIALGLLIIVGFGAYSARGLGGAYRSVEKDLIESE